MLTTSRSNRESGVSALILASSLLLLMGMAAVTVDLGAAFNERRQDQSSADAAALAAGVEILIGNSYEEAVAAAKSFVDQNLGRTLTAAQWSQCTDTDHVGLTTREAANGLDPSQPCISFGQSAGGQAFSHIRVRVPVQETPTTFGRVLGVFTLQTSAAAEVELVPLLGQGAFPASVFNGTAAGTTVCIKTGTGSANQTSCGDPSTGNFGNFRPYFYTEIHPSNPNSMCNDGSSVNALGFIMSNGLDHSLGIAPGAGLGTRVNGDSCPGQSGPINPDRVRSGSGYSNNDVTQGLISGGTWDSTPYVGRLTKPTPWSGSYGAATIFTRPVDNRPLWTFIDPAQALLADVAVNVATPQVPAFAACSAAAAGPSFITTLAEEPAFETAQAALTQCLTAFAGLPIPPADGLFVEALFDSPRLTIVPEYHQLVPIGNNSCCYDLKGSQPVYLNSVWTAHGPQWTCSPAMSTASGDYCRHDPGRAGSITINAAGQQRVASASAIVLNCDLLGGAAPSADKCKKIEATSGNFFTNFVNLFLTK